MWILGHGQKFAFWVTFTGNDKMIANTLLDILDVVVGREDVG